uniref:Alternative protein CEP95 n=1 Tax=Homo sapiens TaxID=9606 RepID=L8E9K4_HUMAN|nr:alternative protein CEP95 [Homo sapiens]
MMMMFSSGNWKLSASDLGFSWLPFSTVKVPPYEARLDNSR